MKQTIEIPDGFELKKVSETKYEIVSCERKLPKTWEEFCEIVPLKKGESWVDSDSTIRKINKDCVGGERKRQWYNLLPSEEKAKAIFVLGQLIQLRDYYNDGWIPDWADGTPKYCIVFGSKNWFKGCYSCDAQLFYFKTETLRNEFFKNFKNFLNKVNSLYM